MKKKSIIIKSPKKFNKKPERSLKLKIKVSKDIFMIFLALNAIGYNDENNKNGMHPIRKKARAVLKRKNWKKECSYFEKIFKKSDPWYLIRAVLKDPTQIKTSEGCFVSNLKKFSEEPSAKNSWELLKKHHIKEADKLFPKFKKETTRMIKFINESPSDLKKIILIPNLLDAFWRGYGIKIQNIGYIIVGPGAEKNYGELIRHELLHIIAPKFHIPSRFLLEKNHRHAMKLGYIGQKIIRQEYTILALNLLYQSKILKRKIEKDILREEKYFPHIRKVMETIKGILEKN